MHSSEKFKQFKLLLVLLLLIFHFPITAYSQSYDPHRGMQCGNFATFTPKSLNDGYPLLNINFSVLGNAAREDSLLEYASKNHITSLSLYDLYVVFRFNDTPNTQVNGVKLVELLCNFMNKARNQYCITEIGVTGGVDSFFFDATSDTSTAMRNIQHSPAITLDSLIGINIQQNDSVLYYLLTHAFNQGDSLLRSSILMKFFYSVLFPQSSVCNYYFDFLCYENEWWNYGNVNSSLMDLQHMRTLESIYNPIHLHPLQTSVYVRSSFLGIVDSTQQAIINHLDGTSDSLLPRLADRILAVHYGTSPQLSYSGYGGQIQGYADSLTNGGTHYHPYFSTETQSMSGYLDYMGAWLRNKYQNNIFNAEKDFYDRWRFDNGANFGSAPDNIIEPGGAEYFQSYFMVDSLKNPRTFRTNSPICTNGAPGDTLRFTYQGPLERDITYQLKIYNSSQVLVISDTGRTVNYPGTQTNLQLPGHYLLRTGSPYKAVLILNYGGCSYSFADSIFIINSPKIYATSTTSFCRGGNVVLKASAGSSFSWFRNDTAITSGVDPFIIVNQSGNYYCQITGNGTCSGNSNHVIVNVLANPDIVFRTSCYNTDSAEIRIDSPGNQFLWVTGDTTSAIVAKTFGGYRYYATVTQSNLCQRTGYKSLSIPITHFTTNPFISTRDGIRSACSQDSLRLIPTNYGTNSQFYWTYQQNTFFSIADYFVHPAPESSFEVALHMISGSGCDGYDTASIQIYHCCSAQDTTIFGSDSTSHYSNWNNKTLNIEGDLIVNSNFTISSSSLLMDSSSKIVILPGQTLTVQNSNITPCNNTWKGIYLSDGAFLNLSGSAISKADTAIAAFGNARVILHDNVLSDNFTCLSLHDGNFNTSVIEGNRFQGSLQIGQKGIRLSNVNQVSIGLTTGDQNIFRALYYGIYSLNSDAEILACTFDSIFRICTPGPGSFEKACSFFSGSAVFGYSTAGKNTITVGGSPAKACYIYNCRSGITLIGDVNLNASHNIFDNASYLRPETSYAIYTIQSDSCEKIIRENRVDNFNNGFHLYNSLHAKVRIFNNFFNTHPFANSPAGNIAISLESVNPNTADTLEIDNNFINHFDKGIITANQQRLCIRGNQIAIDYSTIPDRTWAGIKVYKGINDTIFNNSITRAWVPLNAFEKRIFGISIESGENNVVSNNTLINLGTGIRFFNSAIQNTVSCNSLSQNLNQITLEVAHIGDQGDPSRASDNFWTRLDNGQQQTLANILVIDSVFLPPLPVWWVQNLPGFHPDINGLNCPGYICPFPSPISISSAPSANSCSFGCNDPDCIQALVVDLIGTLAGSTDPDNMTEYLKRKYAFDLIKQDTLLMHLGNTNDIKLQDFYAEMSLSNSFYLNAILDLLSRNDTLYASIINSFITPENLFESNIVMLNEVYLATWAQGNFFIDSISRTKLEFIALQNPISGGEAVYGARIMLGIDIADYYFEFNNQKKRKETITTANTTGRIIPNPNSGDMQFVYMLKEEDNALLEIFDTKGVLLQTFKLDPLAQSIPVHMELFPCGIYPYRLIINDTKISSDKIIIKK